MTLLAYTLSPALNLTSDPLVTSAARETSLSLKAQKDWRYNFDAEDVAIPFELVTGADAVMQRAIIRGRWVLGEWFLDQSQGVPYLQRVLVSSPNLAAIQQLFVAVFLSVPFVARVDGMRLVHDKVKRRLRIDDFTLVLSDTTTIKLDAPFIL